MPTRNLSGVTFMFKKKKTKSRKNVPLTGKEISFDEKEFIVSKTNLKGIITYANDVFLEVGGFEEHELINVNHNIIRHPLMPKCVFKLLWDTIKTGNEIFAYVVNKAKNGDAYWVFAHVTPTFDDAGNVIGYHSNRRVPKPSAVETMKGLYQALNEEEKKHRHPKEAIEASYKMLVNILNEKGVSYDEFIFAV